MEFMDEEIVRVRNEAKKRAANEDISKGVTIKGEFLEFEEQKLFENFISVLLPKTFLDMPVEVAKAKYPSENRPKIIKTNADGSVNFTFSKIDAAVPAGEIAKMRDGLKSVILRVNPANIFYETGEELLDDVPVAWFDFKGFAIDAQIYNFMYVVAIEDKTVLGILNCMFTEVEDWKPIALQVMRSIKKVEKGEV